MRMYDNFEDYRKFVVVYCKARVKCIKCVRLLAWYIVEPHFDPNNWYSFFLEKPNGNIIVSIFDWYKTPIIKQYAELGVINQEPTVSEHNIELSENSTKELKILLKAIGTKHEWQIEPIYLDGIRKILHIEKSPPYIVKWNMKSNNQELNNFTDFCDKNLFTQL
ncbi:MAG: hypothetical protein GY810_10575 [Aureispira sp.]|nr:hypothetical protein [Aureispira sp.]